MSDVFNKKLDLHDFLEEIQKTANEAAEELRRKKQNAGTGAAEELPEED